MKSKIKVAAAATIMALAMVIMPFGLSVNTYATGSAATGAKSQVQNGMEGTGLKGGASLESTVQTIINTMLFIVGILAVAMIIYSGIKYVTSTGDAKKVESAKNTLIYSIVGLIVAILAYAIVNFVVSRL